MQVFCNWSINCWNFVSGSSAPSIGSARSLASPVPEVCGGCTGLQWVLHSWLGTGELDGGRFDCMDGRRELFFQGPVQTGREGVKEGDKERREGKRWKPSWRLHALQPISTRMPSRETSQDKQDRCCRPICMLLLFAKRLFCPAASGPFSFPQILVVSICFDPLVLLLLFFHVLSYPLLRFFPRVQSIRYPKQ